jgi:hypothetical protein
MNTGNPTKKPGFSDNLSVITEILQHSQLAIGAGSPTIFQSQKPS